MDAAPGSLLQLSARFVPLPAAQRRADATIRSRTLSACPATPPWIALILTLWKSSSFPYEAGRYTPAAGCRPTGWQNVRMPTREKNLGDKCTDQYHAKEGHGQVLRELDYRATTSPANLFLHLGPGRSRGRCMRVRLANLTTTCNTWLRVQDTCNILDTVSKVGFFLVQNWYFRAVCAVLHSSIAPLPGPCPNHHKNHDLPCLGLHPAVIPKK